MTLVHQGLISYIANIATGGELPKATTTDLDAARLFRYLEIRGTSTAVIFIRVCSRSLDDNGPNAVVATIGQCTRKRLTNFYGQTK